MGIRRGEAEREEGRRGGGEEREREREKEAKRSAVGITL